MIVPVNCGECEAAARRVEGALCARHTMTESATVTINADRRGALGPPLRHAFAYVTGTVPRFTAEGRRIA